MEDRTEIVDGHDPEIDDEEEGSVEAVDLHHFIVTLTGGAPPQRVADSTGIDDVMQRVRSERGRKGDVRFPGSGHISSGGGELAIHSIRSDLIAGVAEIFPVMCETCEDVELIAPYAVDDDGDPVCQQCLAEDDDEDDGDLTGGVPSGGGGRVISLDRVATAEAEKDRAALPVGFSPDGI